MNLFFAKICIATVDMLLFMTLWDHFFQTTDRQTFSHQRSVIEVDLVDIKALGSWSNFMSQYRRLCPETCGGAYLE